jgi:hypothetical protein
MVQNTKVNGWKTNKEGYGRYYNAETKDFYEGQFEKDQKDGIGVMITKH